MKIFCIADENGQCLPINHLGRLVVQKRWGHLQYYTDVGRLDGIVFYTLMNLRADVQERL